MGTDPAAAGRAGEGKAVPPGIDTSTAHPARVYDYWLGGKDNFAADREAAELALQAYPELAKAVQSNRAFLARAVRYLTGRVSGSSLMSGPASPPPAIPTRSPSARRRTAGSSTWTTTPSCSCMPRPC